MAVVKTFEDAFNEANLLDESGLLYIAAEYPTNGSVTFPNGDGTNEDEIIDSMASYTFENVGYFTDASISHTIENEKTKESDACGHEEISNSLDLIPTLTATIQEIGNIDLFAKLIGQSVQTIVGGAVVGRNLDLTFDAYSVCRTVTSAKEYDAGTTSVTAVVGSVDGALALTTDYLVVTGADGDTLIELVSGWAITTLNQTFTVTFDADVKDKKQLAYKAGTRSMPYMLLRFCECDTETRARIHYVVKARVSTETVMEFINESRTDFTGATITWTVAKDGNYAQSQINLP